MNHYVNIMHSFEEKGKDDIPTDEELLLFSESEDEVKPKKLNLNMVISEPTPFVAGRFVKPLRFAAGCIIPTVKILIIHC